MDPFIAISIFNNLLSSSTQITFHLHPEARLMRPDKDFDDVSLRELLSSTLETLDIGDKQTPEDASSGEIIDR